MRVVTQLRPLLWQQARTGLPLGGESRTISGARARAKIQTNQVITRIRGKHRLFTSQPSRRARKFIPRNLRNGDGFANRTEASRSEERRVGKECVSTCSSRGSRDP